MRKTKTPREIHCFLQGVKPGTSYAVLSFKKTQYVHGSIPSILTLLSILIQATCMPHTTIIYAS